MKGHAVDRYEIKLKISEIEKLYHTKKYIAASKLAKEVDWMKVKRWDTLAMMIDIYEQLGENEEARDIAVIAYNKNLGGKRLLYRLTDIFIKVNELENAGEIYTEYVASSKNSADKYILEYHLRRANKEPTKKLIESLENYIEKEVDERYLYRLAQLYFKEEEYDKVIKICDDICIMFKDCPYVEGAVKLKKRAGGVLSEEQEIINKSSHVKMEELSKTKQLLFTDQIDLLKKQKEDAYKKGFLPEDFIDEKEKVNTPSSLFSVNDDEIDKDEYGEEEIEEKAEKEDFSYENFSYEDFVQNDDFMDEVKNDDFKEDDKNINKEELLNVFANDEEENTAQNTKELDEILSLKKEDDDFIPSYDNEEEKTFNEISNNLNKENTLSNGLQGLISAAKEKIEADYEKMLENDAKNKKRVALSYALEDEKMADTINKILTHEDTSFDDEQVEGQLNMNDWISEVRQIRYGNKDTKEFSVTELERLLDEKDEKSLAYDRLMQEQRSLAKKTGKPFDEALAKHNVEVQMMATAAKTDLAIRTGRATEKLENKFRKQFAKKTPQERLLDIFSQSTLSRKNEVDISLLSGLNAIETMPLEVAIASATVMSYLSNAYKPNSLVDAVSILIEQMKKEKENVHKLGENKLDNSIKVKDGNITNNLASKEFKSYEDIHLSNKEILENEKAEKEKLIPVENVEEKEAENEEDTNLYERIDTNLVTDAIDDDIAKDEMELFGEVVAKSNRENEEEYIEALLNATKHIPDLIDSKHYPDEEMLAKIDKEEESVYEMTPIDEVKNDMKAMIENDKFFCDLSEKEIEDIINIDVARKHNHEEAASKITAKVTGIYDKPLVTKEILDEYNKKKEESRIDLTKNIDKELLKQMLDEEGTKKEENHSKEVDKLDDIIKNEEVKIEPLPEAKRNKIVSLFSDFDEVPKIDEQIERFINNLPKDMERKDSSRGNVLLSSNEKGTAATFIKALNKAYNTAYPTNKKKIFKVSATEVNEEGFLNWGLKAKGNIILVEEANALSKETLNELLSLLNTDTGRMIVILLDKLEAMKELKERNKFVSRIFTNEFILRSCNADELVEIAKEFASRKDFTIDETAIIVLKDELESLINKGTNLTLDDINDFIDTAIKYASKRMKKLKKQTGYASNIILAEDFR